MKRGDDDAVLLVAIGKEITANDTEALVILSNRDSKLVREVFTLLQY